MREKPPDACRSTKRRRALAFARRVRSLGVLDARCCVERAHCALFEATGQSTRRVSPRREPQRGYADVRISPANAMAADHRDGADALTRCVAPDGEVDAAGATAGSISFARREACRETEVGDATSARRFARRDHARPHRGSSPSSSASAVARTLVGPGLPVWSLAFLPDSRTLVTGGTDRLVRRWDATTGDHLGSVALGATDDPLAAYAGDRGAEVFRACIACHTLSADEGNRAGPTLHRIFARIARCRYALLAAPRMYSVDAGTGEAVRIARRLPPAPNGIRPSARPLPGRWSVFGAVTESYRARKALRPAFLPSMPPYFPIMIAARRISRCDPDGDPAMRPYHAPRLWVLAVILSSVFNEILRSRADERAPPSTRSRVRARRRSHREALRTVVEPSRKLLLRFLDADRCVARPPLRPALRPPPPADASVRSKPCSPSSDVAPGSHPDEYFYDFLLVSRPCTLLSWRAVLGLRTVLSGTVRHAQSMPPFVDASWKAPRRPRRPEPARHPTVAARPSSRSRLSGKSTRRRPPSSSCGRDPQRRHPRDPDHAGLAFAQHERAHCDRARQREDRISRLVFA